jgi:hypothetical protein
MDYFSDRPKERCAVESAIVARLGQWKGDDAIALVRELNAIAVQTYNNAKGRSENG